ncbi:uncharacterized protein [Nicotiana tomentosiformis]|uniref:uncharacterized protein n=1 Tax=Nicotiana tomentosiformis TaxID=4098 RepID=UPI00388CCD61
MASSSKRAGSSKNKNKAGDSTPLTVDSIIPRKLSTTKDFEEKFPTANPHTWDIEKDWEKIQALSRECLLNNAMHNAVAANFLASEGLQRLIREKEELTFEQNQLLVERDQTVLCLSELETKATESVVLEARLQQSKQEVVTLSQEISPLSVIFDEAKAKWAEVQYVVIAATEREAATAEKVTNLEAALNSIIEELATVREKHAQLEEKYKKIIEHNNLFSSTVHDLDVSLRSFRFARESLSAEVTQLKEELKHRATSLLVEKTYVMYIMRRKTLEEAKIVSFLMPKLLRPESLSWLLKMDS